jgi:hypothetical protein
MFHPARSELGGADLMASDPAREPAPRHWLPRLIAEDFELANRIVAAAGVSWFTIEYWKKRPHATARIEDAADEAAARMAAHYQRLE